MPRSGGEAGKFGDRFEGIISVDCLLDILEGRWLSIEFEPVDPGEASGVELIRLGADGDRSFLSAKRQSKRNDAWMFRDLASRTATEEHGVLGTWLRKLKLDPKSTVTFVTQSATAGLLELPHLAARMETFEAFERFLGTPAPSQPTRSKATRSKATNADDFQLLAEIVGNREGAFEACRRLRVVVRVEGDLCEEVDERISALCRTGQVSPAAIRALLAMDFIIPRLGKVIHRQDIVEFLRSQSIELLDAADLASDLEIIQSRSVGFVEQLTPLLINGEPADRQEAREVLRLLSEGATTILVEGDAGSGKSNVLRQVISQLLGRGVPVLAFRLDLIPKVETTNQLGAEWGFATSPVAALRQTSYDAPVLIIDQLDAISALSGRNQTLFTMVHELFHQARSRSDLRIVVACRTFDLEYDEALRALSRVNLAKRVQVGLFPEALVELAMTKRGLARSQVSTAQFQMLQLPRNLYLFTQIDDLDPKRFITGKALLDRYWEAKSKATTMAIGDNRAWIETITLLCQELSRRQELSCPRAVLDAAEHAVAREVLLSESVLIQDDQQVAFFHESFFDYAFARTFAGHHRDLREWLESEEQSLFRRSQVRQILEYRRADDVPAYLRDLHGLISGDGVRFHIKQLVLDWLRTLSRPTEREWRILETAALQASAPMSELIIGAIRNNTGWFDTLYANGSWSRWLESSDAQIVNRAIRLLSMPSVLKDRPTQVAALLTPMLDAEEEGIARLKYVMGRSDGLLGSGLQDLFVNLMSRGAYDDEDAGSEALEDFWSLLAATVETDPEFCVRAIAQRIQRMMTMQPNDIGGNPLVRGGGRSHSWAEAIYRSSELAPSEFLREILPRVIGAAKLFGGNIWPRVAGRPTYDWRSAIVYAVTIAAETMARTSPELLREALSIEDDSEIGDFFRLIAWSFVPESYAVEILEFLAEKPTRLGLSYQSGERDSKLHVAETAVSSIVNYLSYEQIRQLESLIVAFVPDYELRPENKHRRGLTRLGLLRAFPPAKLSNAGKRILAELERKFPPPPAGAQHWRVEDLFASPVPAAAFDKMTDDQLLGAMTSYVPDISAASITQRNGGAAELAREVSAAARKQPARFADFALRFGPQVSDLYVEAILSGLLESIDKAAPLNAAAADRVWEVLEYLHELPDKPSGSAILQAIQALTKFVIPDKVLKILEWYLVNSSDPLPGHDDDELDSVQDGGLHSTWVLDSIRVRAAWAMVAYLQGHPESVSILLPALESAAADESARVRATTIPAFNVIARSDFDLGLRLFLRATEDCESIRGSVYADNFLHDMAYLHYDHLRPLLMEMLLSRRPGSRYTAARQICVAALVNATAAQDLEPIRSGDVYQRRALAEVYARNCGEPGVATECRRRVLRYFNDDSKEVREAAVDAFRRISADDLANGSELLDSFLGSKAFTEGADELVRQLENASRPPGEFIAELAILAAQRFGHAAGDIQTHAASVAHGLSTIVLRAYHQADEPETRRKLLDAIDLMYENQFIGLRNEVDKFARQP